jgi:hypothetical protein
MCLSVGFADALVPAQVDRAATGALAYSVSRTSGRNCKADPNIAGNYQGLAQMGLRPNYGGTDWLFAADSQSAPQIA